MMREPEDWERVEASMPPDVWHKRLEEDFRGTHGNEAQYLEPFQARCGRWVRRGWGKGIPPKCPRCYPGERQP